MCAARARPARGFVFLFFFLIPPLPRLLTPLRAPASRFGGRASPAPSGSSRTSCCPAFLFGPLPRPPPRRATAPGYCFRVRVSCLRGWLGTGPAVCHPLPRRAAHAPETGLPAADPEKPPMFSLPPAGRCAAVPPSLPGPRSHPWGPPPPIAPTSTPQPSRLPPSCSVERLT